MKMLRNKKALSPVVASIILIAVTVAVSIAVAAWMGALTFTFMGTEELKITDLNFDTVDQIGVVCKNTGTSPVTLSEVWINNAKHSEITVAISANNQTTITVAGLGSFGGDASWVPGNTYEVKLVSSKGNAFLRTETAPST